ncbi:hypothetical protein DYB25_006828, partial [Aphanomyces astaci]
MHNAEQQVARTQSLLNAVRDTHPGPIRRIERMYSDESILAGDLKDVIHLHILRTSEAQQAALAAYEQNVLQTHMHADNADDQLLLRRVKWVLNRLRLNYDTVADMLLATPQDVQALSSQMHQLHALYEFLRSGDTTSLVEENIPLTKELHLLEASLAVPGEDRGGMVLDSPALLATDDQWSKFVQDVAQKFPPKRFVPIQDRLVSYALNRVEEKRLAQWETQKPTIYRHDKKKYSSSAQPTPTSSFAIHHAPMIGTLDSLTANCNDAVQVCTEHTTLLCTLSPSISVQHSVLKSPIPFVRDRDAVFSQVQRSYVDSKGRQCYAWYRTSLAAVAAPLTACIRATVNSWGCVLVQVTPHTLTQFTVMDVDWSGNVSSWVAARLASKLVAPLTLVGHRASSAPSSATISREPPK